MTLRHELLDELLKEYKNPEDLLGEGGILKQLTKALIERCLKIKDSDTGEIELIRRVYRDGGYRNIFIEFVR